MKLPHSRAARLGLATAAMIALGGGGGYLAAEAFTPAAPTSAVESGHDHGSSNANTAAQLHAGHANTGTHGIAGHEDADAHGTAGHEDAGTQATGQDGGHGEHGEHGEQVAAPVERPRAAVLGMFAAVNAAIMVAAVVLRRRRPRQSGPRTRLTIRPV
ncbi:hypothetical protein [Actinoplanes campanulatus]|uniref:hypothetical protein n=1 Tax=Actinoplanes campanulatus TaxID=113559 RepID=UPI0019547D08|nr:hypothetical protein [Actinoplanes capillaceus]